MAEFYFDNLARNLPDAYKKDKSSNNYKILEIERRANNVSRSFLEEIAAILDINKATGATLDMYGKRFGQARGRTTDAQFSKMIKSKIICSQSSGSYKDIVDAICYTFGCNKDEIELVESKTTPMTVTLNQIPLETIIRAGLTTRQAEQIIKSLLPVAVDLESVLFEGTFMFSDTDEEYDAAAGFTDVEGGTIGGYFGAAESDMNDDELPI